MLPTCRGVARIAAASSEARSVPAFDTYFKNCSGLSRYGMVARRLNALHDPSVV